MADNPSAAWLVKSTWILNRLEANNYAGLWPMRHSHSKFSTSSSRLAIIVSLRKGLTRVSASLQTTALPANLTNPHAATKTLNRGTSELIVLAADTVSSVSHPVDVYSPLLTSRLPQAPLAILLHLPLLCEGTYNQSEQINCQANSVL